MRVEQAVAGKAAQARPGDEAVLGEHMAGHVLLAAGPFAALATELSVERSEGLAGRLELVCVPLNELASELLVHRFEQHDVSLNLVA
jgi:hypothetical protein